MLFSVIHIVPVQFSMMNPSNMQTKVVEERITWSCLYGEEVSQVIMLLDKSLKGNFPIVREIYSTNKSHTAESAPRHWHAWARKSKLLHW